MVLWGMAAVSPEVPSTTGPLPFAVTGTGELSLANDRTGATTFTVTNLTGRPLRVRLLPKGADPTQDAWYRLAGDTEVPLAVGATISVEVRAKVPDTVAEGRYPLALRAVDESDPELLTDGQPVQVVVPKVAPKAAFPLVPVIIGVLVVLLLGGGAIWWFLLRKPAPVTATPSPVASPANLAAPSLSGTVRVGGTLTVAPGDWSGSPTFSYVWIRCDEMANDCTPIPNAANSSYELADADLNRFVRVKVTATNSGGVASAETQNRGPVGARSNGCKPGYVPRLARPEDRVCVSPAVAADVVADNAVKESRWISGPYGPHTCLNGYVWREAFVGDDVCVIPERRSQAFADNAAAASRAES